MRFRIRVPSGHDGIHGDAVWSVRLARCYILIVQNLQGGDPKVFNHQALFDPNAVSPEAGIDIR